MALYSNRPLPKKHFFFPKTSSKYLQDFFSVTIFRPPMRLLNVFKTSSQDIVKTCLQDVFFKTSSRRCVVIIFLQDKKSYRKDVFKTSSVSLYQDKRLFVLLQSQHIFFTKASESANYILYTTLYKKGVRPFYWCVVAYLEERRDNVYMLQYKWAFPYFVRHIEK